MKPKWFLITLVICFGVLSINCSKEITPTDACGYLSGRGFPPEKYSMGMGGKFMCISSKPLGNDNKTSFEYSVFGSEKKIEELQLSIESNEPEAIKSNRAEFLSTANDLAQKALGKPLPDKVQAAIRKGERTEEADNNVKFYYAEVGKISGLVIRLVP